VLVGHKDGSAEHGTVTADDNSADGGEKTHTLTEDEMPAHKHISPYGVTDSANFRFGTEDSGAEDQVGARSNPDSDNRYFGYTSEKGGDASHNNLQPYKNIYMWERTA
jgi:microcystin-dependent protein